MRENFYWQDKTDKMKMHKGYLNVKRPNTNTHDVDWVDAWNNGKPRPSNAYPSEGLLRGYYKIPKNKIFDPCAYHTWRLSELKDLLEKQKAYVKTDCEKKGMRSN